MIEFVSGAIVGGSLFMLGYHLGRNHERSGWTLWLQHKIPRLDGQEETDTWPKCHKCRQPIYHGHAC